jgi:GNAT superfamily N-acetyltransferase
MREILANPSNEKLGKAIIHNHISYMRVLGKTPYAKIIENNEYLNIDFGLKIPSAQGIYYSNTPPDKAEELIKTISTYYQEQNQPFTWGVLPYTQPQDMGERLLAKGFNYDGPYPAMAVNLEELVDEEITIEGFSYEIVSNDEKSRIFWDVWTDGYNMHKQFGDLLFNVSIYNGFDNILKRHYLGYLNGEPVGTSKLLLSDGVAGVHDVTVLPSARRRGIGTEMSLLPLRDAKASGYNYSVLCATKQGLPVYEKLGFKEYLQWDWFSKENK